MAHILLIDDEPAIGALFAEALQEAGHSVDVASDGRVVHGKGALEPYDVVVTDLMMPNVDGLEVIGIVAQSNPRARILAVSGGGAFVSADYLPIAKELGAHVVLYKPILPDDLVEEVARQLEAAALA